MDEKSQNRRNMRITLVLLLILNLNGILAMEAFVSNAGHIIFNEIAPRPHNSFHWTIEGCVTSQFAQLVRIIAGLGPGDTSARGSWQMDNLLGEDLHRLPALYADANKAVHLYGKTEARNGRKMGHVTWELG
ncbi:MAG: ATP-grasp domain-containing protein [Candidatus Puniceispirillaceae bacterium]